jgi:hypothetical protein
MYPSSRYLVVLVLPVAFGGRQADGSHEPAEGDGVRLKDGHVVVSLFEPMTAGNNVSNARVLPKIRCSLN